MPSTKKGANNFIFFNILPKKIGLGGVGVCSFFFFPPLTNNVKIDVFNAKRLEYHV